MEDTPFSSYTCSLGAVTAHADDGMTYCITGSDGRTIGIPAQTTCSADNVEADIAVAQSSAAAAATAAAQAELMKQCEDYSQARLDTFAHANGIYDDIHTMMQGQGSSIPAIRAEGEAAQAAYDAEWGAARDFQSAVLAGSIEPTFDNYKAAMPVSYSAPEHITQ